QRGGALTGYVTIEVDDGPRQAVVKLPVPPRERHWLSRLQDSPDVAPQLYAHGERLNGYDLAWVVMERLPHGPLGASWDGHEFDLLIDAAVRFYAASATVPLHGEPFRRDWVQVFNQARQNVHLSCVGQE